MAHKARTKTRTPTKRTSSTRSTFDSSKTHGRRQADGRRARAADLDVGTRGRERVQRLERAGVIRGYRAEVDPRAVGFPIATSDPSYCAGPARADPGDRPRDTRGRGVLPDHREDCYLLKLHLRAIDELEELLDRFTPTD